MSGAVSGAVPRFVFVGERRSATAIRRGWTWLSGRLAARTLHDALGACGVDPSLQMYVNLWTDTGEPDALAPLYVRDAARLGLVVVGMGRRVQRELRRLGFPHLELVHPAARGRVRSSRAYREHVASVLTSVLTRAVVPAALERPDRARGSARRGSPGAPEAA